MTHNDLDRDLLIAELSAVRRDWNAIFNAVGQLAMILDPDRRILLVSKATAAALKVDKEELVGLKCTQVFHGSDVPPDNCPLENLLSRDETGPVEMEVEALGRSFLVSCTPVADQDREPARFIHLAQDITKLKRTEAALRNSEEKYKFLADHMGDILWTADLNFRSTYVSPSVQRILGFTQEERLRQRPDQKITPQSMTVARRLAAEVLEREKQAGTDPEQIITAEMEYFKKNGSTVWLENSVNLIRDDAGAIIGLAGVSRDITERKAAQHRQARLEALLHRSQKMEALGTLAGGIAHDFNNILAIIIGYAELTAMDFPEYDSARNNLEQILKAADRAKDLVGRILTFSRQTESKLLSLDLNRNLMGARDRIERAIPKNIRLELDLDPDLSPIRGDESQLEQVLINLAANAADAMSDGGVLTFTTANQTVSGMTCHYCGREFSGRYVVLKAADTGTGVSPADRERIFDPFFTTKGVGRGTGLGLSIVYGIVASHGGHIRCRSAAKQGAVFEIYLPAEPEAKAAETR